MANLADVSSGVNWQNTWLEGDVLQEIGLKRVMHTNLGRDLLERIQNRLVQIIQGEKLTAQQRAGAGTTLGVLGDPRFDVGNMFLPSEPLFGFRHIPKGKFIMGSDKEKDKEADDDEEPQHDLDIPYDYYLAHYPMTVAQYKYFVQDSGYKTQDEDSLRGVPNHPVVNVTWYDALEYCKWLDGKLKAVSRQMAEEAQDKDQIAFWQGLADGKLHVTLPSEAEWEKASRGTDGRIYPWGNKFDPDKTNSWETGIGSISAVGCFPSGESPYGLLEISGNVYEWMRSLDKDYPYQNDAREVIEAKDDDVIVIRGGAFFNTARSVRCALRFNLYPFYGDGSVGFRLVVSPRSAA